MLQTIKRLTGWPWFDLGPAPIFTAIPYSTFRWQDHAWFRQSRIEEIDAQVRDLKTAIETAKKTKRARRHLYAKLHELTTERLRLEGEG